MAKGVGFIGDHEELFGTLYTKADSQFDSVCERALGLGAPDTFSEPSSIFEKVLTELKAFPKISGTTEESLTTNTKAVLDKVCQTITEKTKQIPEKDLTKGLDNLLSQIIDDIEGFGYKFSRRTKKDNS